MRKSWPTLASDIVKVLCSIGLCLSTCQRWRELRKYYCKLCSGTPFFIPSEVPGSWSAMFSPKAYVRHGSVICCITLRTIFAWRLFVNVALGSWDIWSLVGVEAYLTPLSTQSGRCLHQIRLDAPQLECKKLLEATNSNDLRPWSRTISLHMELVSLSILILIRPSWMGVRQKFWRGVEIFHQWGHHLIRERWWGQLRPQV